MGLLLVIGLTHLRVIWLSARASCLSFCFSEDRHKSSHMQHFLWLKGNETMTFFSWLCRALVGSRAWTLDLNLSSVGLSFGLA